MKTRRGRQSEAFWPSLVMKKWLNIKPQVHDFSEDDVDTETESEDDASSVKDSGLHTDEDHPYNYSRGYKLRHRRGKSETLRVQYIKKKDVRMTIGTWNVAGKSPDANLNIEEWLCMNEPADIYVLGFQEVVPLNAGNVLGAEDSTPIRKWEAIIRRTLNGASESESNLKRSYSDSPSPITTKNSANEIVNITKDRKTVMRRYGIDIDRRLDWPDHLLDTPQIMLPSNLKLRRVLSSSGRCGFEWMENNNNNNSNNNLKRSYKSSGNLQSFYSEQHVRNESLDQLSDVSDEFSQEDSTRPKYVRIVSKQMVGIYVSIWVRRKLRGHITNLKVSPVGVGLMGYMGNKGSVSVSMSLYQSQICFVCSHLTSGHKDGDEQRRNADVYEILRRTRFTSVLDTTDQPRTIPCHDQIFWLGDLNYRLNMSDEEIRKLVFSKKWDELINSDQLMEQIRTGHVFDGWKEGLINFPPTYKYEINSDRYVGTGIKQQFYRRADLRMSDHRPVSSMFCLEIEAVDQRKLQRVLNYNSAAVHPEILFKVIYNGSTKAKGNEAKILCCASQH
ncbi:hypothetical protein V2J09_014831 [Rumex salicifolius]